MSTQCATEPLDLLRAGAVLSPPPPSAAHAPMPLNGVEPADGAGAAGGDSEAGALQQMFAMLGFG